MKGPAKSSALAAFLQRVRIGLVGLAPTEFVSINNNDFRKTPCGLTQSVRTSGKRLM